jgi:hypothetical protein
MEVSRQFHTPAATLAGASYGVKFIVFILPYVSIVLV